MFANQDTERKRAKKAIESIFPVNKFILNNINKVRGEKNSSEAKKPSTRTKIHRNLTVQKEAPKPPLANFLGAKAAGTAQKRENKTQRMSHLEKPMPKFV